MTRAVLLRGVRELARRDGDLAEIVERHGPPPMWRRRPGFSTLVHIILEQQVSLASARAAHNRLLEQASPLTPGRFLELGDQQLKAIGFSRQKTLYCRHLAEAILEGRLDLEALNRLEDDAVRRQLTQVKGVGPWTANIYLLMVLLRPDVWPVGDLALATAAQRAKGLPTRPNPQQLDELGAGWKPWRAVAARLLWHLYLSG